MKRIISFLLCAAMLTLTACAPREEPPIIDPAPAVARRLHEVMSEEQIIKREGFSLSLHASGDSSLLRSMAEKL